MELVLYEVKERIGFITLNRPDKRNALSHELVSALIENFDRAEKDASVKVIVLRAHGDAFCAGADLASLQKMQTNTFEENLADSTHLKDLFLKIYQLKKVVIAQVQGHALAGGCGLASVCDFIFAVPEAKFGYTEVKIGFIPALVLVFLIRKIGEQHAKFLLLSGELVQGEEAKRAGLCHVVVTKNDLEKKVNEFAQQLVKNNSAHAMTLTKEMIDHVQSLSLTEALNYAATRNAEARASADCRKGVTAFLNKEKIMW
ncbi:MAG: Enoyl-CoA hydratase [Cytophagales bacterium]|jgi:methylglutaconyl-CoA hydratase|nr:enoyl-CoA hydratase/isomerase family protein [Bacteroidota bacterium]MBS1982222.1 enoyl-CoA hydratase/isomerase family protein [Bacteroidota bacterium]WHZ09041.1 MAG: Enoyl-CoA hydratase [Cytophagales bacterium]